MHCVLAAAAFSKIANFSPGNTTSAANLPPTLPLPPNRDGAKEGEREKKVQSSAASRISRTNQRVFLCSILKEFASSYSRLLDSAAFLSLSCKAWAEGVGLLFLCLQRQQQPLPNDHVRLADQEGRRIASRIRALLGLRSLNEKLKKIRLRLCHKV